MMPKENIAKENIAQLVIKLENGRKTLDFAQTSHQETVQEIERYVLKLGEEVKLMQRAYEGSGSVNEQRDPKALYALQEICANYHWLYYHLPETSRKEMQKIEIPVYFGEK